MDQEEKAGMHAMVQYYKYLILDQTPILVRDTETHNFLQCTLERVILFSNDGMRDDPIFILRDCFSQIRAEVASKCQVEK